MKSVRHYTVVFVLSAQYKILLSKINTEALPWEGKHSGYLCFSVFLEFSEARSLSIFQIGKVQFFFFLNEFPYDSLDFHGACCYVSFHP